MTENCGACRFWVLSNDSTPYYEQWKLGSCIRYPPKIMRMENIYSDGSGGQRPVCLFPMTADSQKCGEFKRKIEEERSSDTTDQQINPSA